MKMKKNLVHGVDDDSGSQIVSLNCDVVDVDVKVDVVVTIGVTNEFWR